MNVPDLSIRFAGATLGEHRHICAFFNNPDEEYRALLPFIKEGLERGEKGFHVVGPKARRDHLERLRSYGIDANGAIERGQLELYDWNDAYFPDGRFDHHRMLAMWERTFADAARKGYPLTRLVANMGWAFEGRSGIDDLLEYEAKFNLLPPHGNPVGCAYDLRKVPGDVVVDIMRTHPMIIIGGRLHENPFFVPPEELLRELRDRKRER